MATTFSWTTPGTIATALSTELNALANAAFTVASSAIDNETTPSLYLNAELVLASLTPTGAPYCALFIAYSIDSGTNYEDGPNTASTPIAVWSFTTAVAAKRQNKTNILIAPLKFKLYVQNNMGPSLGATLNTVRYRLSSETGF